MSCIVGFFCRTALWILLLPYGFIFLGAASNQAVLYANNDTFPVKINPAKVALYTTNLIENKDEKALELLDHGYLDKVHVIMTSKTHLNLLADIFDLGSIYSIGDFFIYAGDWLNKFSLVVWGVIVVGRLRKYAF